MIEPKKWATGVSDEAWKVRISLRDAGRAEEIAQYLAYVMTDVGNATFEEELEAIAQFSGEQIAKALFDQRELAVASIQAGMSGATK